MVPQQRTVERLGWNVLPLDLHLIQLTCYGPPPQYWIQHNTSDYNTQYTTTWCTSMSSTSHFTVVHYALTTVYTVNTKAQQTTLHVYQFHQPTCFFKCLVPTMHYDPVGVNPAGFYCFCKCKLFWFLGLSDGHVTHTEFTWRKALISSVIQWYTDALWVVVHYTFHLIYSVLLIQRITLLW